MREIEGCRQEPDTAIRRVSAKAPARSNPSRDSSRLRKLAHGQLSFTKRELERHLAAARLKMSRTSVEKSGYIVGAFYSHPNGLTRGAELQVDAMQRGGHLVRRADGNTRKCDQEKYDWGDTVVLHAGAPETARLLNQVRLPRHKVAVVGYWAWELPDPPRGWARYTNFVDEVWTPSRFSADSLSKVLDLPVRVVPHRVYSEDRHTRHRDEKFTVLTMADSRSSLDRKNPAGAIAAFRAAFGDRSDVRLIVKLMGRTEDLAAFRAQVGNFSNVEFLTRRLTLGELNALYLRADVLLSLHRAEGFGLPILEAMARGLPAVATGWSGNLDFMSDTDSVLVPHRLVEVVDRGNIYQSDSVWAEPDINFAAAALERLADDSTHYEYLSGAAWRRARSNGGFVPPDPEAVRW